jgi:hypothetical protein
MQMKGQEMSNFQHTQVRPGFDSSQQPMFRPRSAAHLDEDRGNVPLGSERCGEGPIFPHRRPNNSNDYCRSVGKQPRPYIAPVSTRGSDTRFKKPNFVPEKNNGENAWMDYSHHFEAVSKINGWNGAEKAMFLLASLRGQAQKILADLPEGGTENYEEIVKVLKLRFGPQQRPELHLAELRGRVRGSNESLRELGQSIRHMPNLAYPGVSPEQRDLLARTHFSDAIGDQDTRMRLFQAKPQTLEETITVALEVETFRKLEERRNGASENNKKTTVRGLGDQGKVT